ncbi:dihydrodipicolinate synthase family protein [Paenibacillus rhizovicinus]|uniref:Dihydrodipicolinate synthase family protein n=1 Tax=Paenibacillus rhizovicinus TaxID=2704463 RepID=A0A6C0P8P9_9BACL|nr:dihydrodipicolinate synthase family protein [Paenibacillus rhizovicinus]QHW34786.1 dihydrodipicolinate synthase family protein [Paenibacillus rhizovicinus]
MNGTTTIKLPQADGSLLDYKLANTEPITAPALPLRSRIAYSAAHVVCDPRSDAEPMLGAAIDWQATMAYRHHLWSLGLAVAEAMDTAQRGMGLDWLRAKELIGHSLAEAEAVKGRIACGAGTDQLVPGPQVMIEQVIEAYAEQCEYIESRGGQVILMASRALAAAAKSPADYERVYGTILRQVSRPVILHWLGDMFDPALAGYWGERDADAAMEVCLRVIHAYPDKVDGIKISLLDADKEVRMRRRLPSGVRMYTGDDFNYPALIEGDEHGYSHALLGIFDAIAPVAAAAIHALDNGDTDRYRALLAPTLPLSRHIFQRPTYAYKTGIVFMAYLNGHQSHFRMLGGAEGARSIVHLAGLFELADRAGLLAKPELAVRRMKQTLAMAGIE